MDVATIIERIASLSLSGSVVDDAVGQAMILSWVQSTYEEVWSEIATEFPTLLETTQDVTVTDGVGTLAPWPMSIKSVADLTNRTFLTVTLASEVEKEDIELTAAGTSPRRYYVTEGTKLNTYVKATIAARVRYTPFAGQLGANGAASTIQFPPQFHDALVWGGLRFAAVDERDKGMGTEIATFQVMYEQRKNALLTWLRTHQAKPKSHVQSPIM